MDINLVRVKRSYEPYQRESAHCFFLAVVFSSIAFLLYGVCGGLRIWKGFLWFLIGYLIVELLTNGYLGLISPIELSKKAFVIDSLFIDKIEIAHSWSGHWGESIIPKLYPKQLRMQSYKVFCTSMDGKSIVLRIAMSQRKLKKLMRYVEIYHSEALMIMFGKYSHIIIEFQGRGYDSIDLNRMQ